MDSAQRGAQGRAVRTLGRCVVGRDVRQRAYSARRTVARRLCAGGHLAALLLAPARLAAAGVPPSCIAGACLVSGVFDLRPLRHTYVNDWLRLPTEEAAAVLSPVHEVEAVGTCAELAGTPVVVAVGQHDPPQFRAQSQAQWARWCEAGAHAGCVCSASARAPRRLAPPTPAHAACAVVVGAAD